MFKQMAIKTVEELQDIAATLAKFGLYLGQTVHVLPLDSDGEESVATIIACEYPSDSPEVAIVYQEKSERNFDGIDATSIVAIREAKVSMVARKRGGWWYAPKFVYSTESVVHKSKRRKTKV